jgi:tRNA pseudouridine55 synthase
VLDVRCGTGTYMRALARDLGAATGCPAHCEELRRTEVGAWDVRDAIAPEQVDAAHVLDAVELVSELPSIQLDDATLADVAAGRRLAASLASGASGPIALLAPDGQLAGIAELTSDGELVQPRIVLVESANRP